MYPITAAIQTIQRADAGTRTPDPFITSEVLYQLSYVGILLYTLSATIVSSARRGAGDLAHGRGPHGI